MGEFRNTDDAQLRWASAMVIACLSAYGARSPAIGTPLFLAARRKSLSIVASAQASFLLTANSWHRGLKAHLQMLSWPVELPSLWIPFDQRLLAWPQADQAAMNITVGL